jgi:uncharacterized protein (DUF952 family)
MSLRAASLKWRVRSNPLFSGSFTANDVRRLLRAEERRSRNDICTVKKPEINLIFHITTRSEWQATQARGEYRAPSLETEGFIHLSTSKQVSSVANAFYRGQSGLVLLVVDEMRVTSQVKWEAPAGTPALGISQDDKFPHVYGPLNLDAVVDVLDFNPDASGNFRLPASLVTDNYLPHIS